MTIKSLPVVPTDTTLVADPVTLTVDSSTLGIAASPTVYNVVIPTANVEQSFALPAHTKAFELAMRGQTELWFCYAAGQSGIAYLRVPIGGTYQKDGLNLTGVSLYFQAKAADTLQITVWV